MTANTIQRRVRQQGLSLIEMMIAVALSAMLILGLVEIFSSTRAAFAASESLARVQENGRFAMEFLRRDVRMAGSFGCTNEFALYQPEYFTAGSATMFNRFGATTAARPYPVQTEFPIEVYDFTGTVPGSAYNLPATPAAAGAAGNYTPSLPAALAAAVIGGANGAIAGSDIVVVRYPDEAPIQIAGYGVGSGNISVPVGSPAVTPFRPYFLTSCLTASLFQVTSVAGVNLEASGGANTVALSALESQYGIGSLLHRLETAVYYVGVGANGPALYRLSLREAPTSAAQGVEFGPAEELIENIEMMQVLVGQSGVNAAGRRVDDTTRYFSPQELLTGTTAGTEDAYLALRRISAVNVSILARSPAGMPIDDPQATTVLVGDVDVTVPVDQRLRKTYDAHITLRNRHRMRG